LHTSEQYAGQPFNRPYRLGRSRHPRPWH
jgi:hypothetical protein